MIVVYLSNQIIRVAEGEYARGSVRLKRLCQVEDAEGCIINGSVADKDGLQALLRELWEKNSLPKKNVTLVINSSQFTTRVLDVPAMKPGPTMDYVRREFADVERIEDPIHSYFPMPGKKQGKVQTLFAGVAPKSFLEMYRQLFAELGITLSRIETVRGPLIRMIDSLESARGKTCIVQVINESTLINLLYVKGSYVYSSRSRLFSDPDTADFAVEAARSVSNMLQFAKSQNIDEPIREVLVAGMEKDTLEIFADAVQRIDERMEARQLQEGRTFQFGAGLGPEDLKHYVMALGGFWPIPEKTSFLAGISYDPEAVARKAKRNKTLIPLALMTVVLSAIAGVLGWKVYHLKKELNEVQAYNQSEAVLAACTEYDAALQEIGVRKRLLNEAERLQACIDAYPVADSEVEALVAACASTLVDARITGYRSQSGVLSIEATSQQMERIYLFVGRLESEAMFEEINYTGYRQTSEGNWSMSVECRLQAAEGSSHDTKADGEG